MTHLPQIKTLGDAALSIEFSDTIDPAIHGRVMALAAAVAAAVAEGGLPGVREIVPSFRALAVHFDPVRIARADVLLHLEPLIAGAGVAEIVGRTWVLPACYCGEYAPDLADVAERAGLTPETVVDLHTQADFRVYILGFLPGFAYLGGVPEVLRLPRRADPRTAVPAGSVAIAGEMSAVYPLQSPGGWHLIGRCPVPMFDPAATPPVFLAPGDTVRFRAIDAQTYAEIQDAAARRAFDVASLRVEA